jgi:hypothetical protein
MVPIHAFYSRGLAINRSGKTLSRATRPRFPALEKKKPA